jgi:hypothetical protein
MKRSDGVDIAHEHAKYLSKYMFSLIHYVQERSIEELEHAERISKLATNSSLSSFLTAYRYLPGIDLMTKTLKKDSTYHTRIQSTWMVLQTHEFVGVNIIRKKQNVNSLVFFRNLIHGEPIMIIYEKQ